MLISTKVLAAGCSISKSLIIVAPSLLMVTFRPSATSLSIPRGPKVVRTASTTPSHALMLLMSCALPCHTQRNKINNGHAIVEKKRGRRWVQNQYTVGQRNIQPTTITYLRCIRTLTEQDNPRSHSISVHCCLLVVATAESAAAIFLGIGGGGFSLLPEWERARMLTWALRNTKKIVNHVVIS